MTDKSSKIQIKETPKICAIDLDPEIIEALRDRGLQCFSGTLGSQVKVPNFNIGNQYPCLPNFDFPPNLHEYDIVIVDLQTHDPIEYKASEHTHLSTKGSKQHILLSKYPEKIFDPRPLSASILYKELVELVEVEKETLIIVFSAANEVIEYNFCSLTPYGHQEYNPESHSLYVFLPFLQGILNKNGKNVIISSNIREEVKNILYKYSKDFRYSAIFEHPTEWVPDENRYIDQNKFIPLLLNNTNEIIGFIYSTYHSHPSRVFVFPQIINKKREFLIELLDEVLPEIFPKIFPYNDQFSWLKSEKYLLPNQKDFIAKKEKIEDEHKKLVAQIEDDIKQNQVQYQFLHDLLSETGDSLVKSVEQFLIWLGFTNIINMDETKPEIKEEDIQIPLDNGLLVVEIKGIGGTSKDRECSQVNKIKNRRQKDRRTFDVFALYLVNHQRYLPPHERENPPFTQHQIDDAKYEERGLLTTYELFQLYFNIEKGFIKKEDARDALLQYGLVQFKPSNAQFIGTPLEIHHKGTVVILQLDNIPLYTGARIIICNNGDYYSAEIIEIKDKGKIVPSASHGEIGVKLSCSVLKTSQLYLN
ncbi:hypothetical protein [Anabaena sp. UHCC 0204]|uniref:hypothetical protein n=1 Tax=Anabaena sp. UHCC 0204 TaxID=2590009 RepID=UPI001446D282|nr:hypothetical protein [Anabaena sp. UHCC 0204]MTJ08437.1 hypothetical protein [Anabaena sp. UHCC 0204]